MISISHLSKSAPDGKTILRDINLEIADGEVICVIGPSGGGKSTLIRCINALETPTSGSVTVDGIDIFGSRADMHTLRGKVGMVFQDINVFPHLDVLGNVTIGPMKILGQGREEAEGRGMELLRLVGLAESAHARPDELSGGQKQRVGIARCLSMEPRIILFDEPTSSLDQAMTTEVQGVIGELARKGMTMMIVTHDLRLARKVATRILFVQDGEICEDGTPEEIFEHPRKTLTRIFIRNRKSVLFDVTSREYDLYKFNADIDWFCQRNNLSGKAFTIELVTEELLTHFLPFTGAAHFRISLSEEKDIHIEVELEGHDSPVISGEGTDEISLMIIQGLCKSIEEKRQENSWMISITL